MAGYYDINAEINKRIDNLKRYMEARPLILGAISASGGGTVGRPTSFIGALPQTRVTYDLSELGLSGTNPGSPSLLDNLNHIRYRLGVLEAGSGTSPGTVTIKEAGVIIASGITVIDFASGFSVNESPTGEANITVTVSGAEHSPVTVQDTGTVDLTITGQLLSAVVKASGISHTNIQDIGSNTHAQIDSHISNTTIHFDELDELADVIVPTPSSGEVLTYMGTNWRNVTPSAGHDPVTVLDTGTLDLILNGQQISGIVKASGISHTDIQNIGTNTHAQIDTHIADTSIHFDELDELADVILTTPASGEYLKYFGTNWRNVTPDAGHSPVTVQDTATVDLTLTDQEIEARVIFSGVNHDQLLNTHNLTTDIDHDQLTNFETNEHFTEGSIDHVNIQSIGTNTHAQIDTHISDTSIHFDELDELSDVVITTPSSGEYLKFLGTSWVNENILATGVLYDNTISNLTATDVQHAIDELKAYVTPITFSGVSINLVVGTYQSGDIDSIQVINDSDSYLINETTGTPAWDVRVVFSGVAEDFNQVIAHLQYDGSVSHTANVQLYNVNTTNWDNIATIVSNPDAFDYMIMDVTDYSNYVDTGTVIVRFNHSDAGNINHTLALDYVVLKRSLAGGGVTEHGGLSGLEDDDHTQYLLVNGTRAMASGLDMGGFIITNVGNVDGVDISAHVADTSIHFDELEELSNVIGIPTSGKVLTYMGTNWRPMTVSGALGAHTHTSDDITDLAEIAVSGTSTLVLTNTGSILYGDVVNSGLTLAGLGDTDVGTAVSGHILKYIGAKWIPATVSGGTGTDDHGALIGLGDDDHTQYVLADGSRAITNGIVINDGANDSDTRVEGTTDENLLYVDAGNDRVGIGTSTPSVLFEVDGATHIAGNLTITGTVDGIDVSTHAADTSIHFDEIDELSDVVVTTPASGEILKYMGTNWRNVVPSAGHDPVTVQDTPTVDLTLTNQQVEARVIFSGVNHNQLLNTHNLTTDIDHDQLTNFTTDEHFLQSAISITASQVSDFDTEVSNNTDVAANTTARHSAVTVLDTGTVDLTLTGQQISAVVKASGISHTDLQGVGTNTHAQIDTHISNTAIHFDELLELSDVIGIPVSGHVLTYMGTNWRPLPFSGAVGAHTHTSDDITDLAEIAVSGTSTLTLTNTGSVLYGDVIPSGITLAGLGDTDLGTAVSGHVLKYIGAKWIPSTVSGGATDHGGLIGLGDDDHTQYALVNGTRAFTGGIIVNENAADSDSRFEGATDQNLVFIEAGTDRVGIGTNDPDEKLHVAGNVTLDNNSAYRIQDSLNNDRDVLRLDDTDNIRVGMYNSGWGDDLKLYAGVNMAFDVNTAVSGFRAFELNTTEAVFNDTAEDYNLRVEGLTKPNLISVDAGNDRVGIGKYPDSDILDIAGDVTISGVVNLVSPTAIKNISLSTPGILSHNLVKNYPSYEQADGTEPLWWGVASATLTEEDATGESLTGSPNERVLKVVTSSTDGGLYQDFVPANEDLLIASNTKVSFGAWVNLTTAGTVTLQLRDTVSGSIASDTTTTTGSWIWLEVTNQTIGANTARIRIYHSATSATFHVANPTFNIGSMVAPFRPRGHRLYYINTQPISNVDPGGTGTWHTVTVSALPTNATMAHITIMLQNGTSANDRFFVKPSFDGTTGVNSQTEVLRAFQSRYIHTNLTIPLNDAKQFLYYDEAATGDSENLYITVKHCWVWE